MEVPARTPPLYIWCIKFSLFTFDCPLLDFPFLSWSNTITIYLIYNLLCSSFLFPGFPELYETPRASSIEPKVASILSYVLCSIGTKYCTNYCKKYSSLQVLKYSIQVVDSITPSIAQCITPWANSSYTANDFHRMMIYWWNEASLGLLSLLHKCPLPLNPPVVWTTHYIAVIHSWALYCISTQPSSIASAHTAQHTDQPRGIFVNTGLLYALHFSQQLSLSLYKK